jgi:hypothetical protein
MVTLNLILKYYIFQNNVGVLIISSTILNCEAKYGGGIRLDKSNSIFLIKRMNVSNCRSTVGNGGALYLVGASGGGNNHVSVVDSTFKGNSAASFGGAIASDRSNRYLTIAGCTIADNTAMQSGTPCIYFLFINRNMK